MNYRSDKYGNALSVLGYGCLRFPRKGNRIDMETTEQQLLLAIENGINYFDTAYIYGGSKAALGEILEKNGLCHRVNIATKLPRYLIKSREGLDKLFREELKLKPNVLIASITHGAKSEVPNGNSVFCEGDSLEVVTSGRGVLQQFNEIFA